MNDLKNKYPDQVNPDDEDHIYFNADPGETKEVKFGDWFVWEDHDGYIQYAVDDSADIAVVINNILSDNNKMKQHNFKDHGDVNGIHLYTFMTDEYIFFCHYTYADEHQAYLFRHQNMS